MAKVSFTAMIESIVGKLAGSVFQDSYGGFQIRSRVSPRNPQTKYQQLRRGEFGFISASWRFLTSLQRQTFIDAAGTPAAALNLYIQSNVNLVLIEEPTITDYVPSTVPIAMPINITSVTSSFFGVTAGGSPSTVPSGTSLLLQVTYGKAPTKIFTNPSQYSPVVTFPEGTDMSGTTDIITEWMARYGQLATGLRVCLKSDLIDTSNGLRGPDSFSCDVVTPGLTSRIIDFDASAIIDIDGTFITFP